MSFDNASLDNGKWLLNYIQDIIKGSILAAAVGLDMMGRGLSELREVA